MLSTGDLVRLTVTAHAASDADEILDRVTSDPAVLSQLAPIPSRSRSAADFGDFSLAQEFIVAAGAELTAVALIAAIRALFNREDLAQHDSQASAEDQTARISHASDVDVTATMRSDGVCEVTVRVTSLR